MYECVSTHNRWDAAVMLANLMFYFQGKVRVGFDYHEDELTDWETCKQKLKDLSGHPFEWKIAKKKDLATRAQTSTELYQGPETPYSSLGTLDPMRIRGGSAVSTTGDCGRPTGNISQTKQCFHDVTDEV